MPYYPSNGGSPFTWIKVEQTMPYPASPLPLTKVTLNLYKEDVARARATFGHGWSEELREIIHKALKPRAKPLTIEDLARKLGDV